MEAAGVEPASTSMQRANTGVPKGIRTRVFALNVSFTVLSESIDNAFPGDCPPEHMPVEGFRLLDTRTDTRNDALGVCEGDD